MSKKTKKTKPANTANDEPRTFSELFLRSVDSFGNRPFLVAAGTGKKFTYAEIGAATYRVAARLEKLKFAPNSRVVVLLPNGPSFFIVFAALNLAGMVPVPFNPAATHEEIAAACGLTSAAAVIVGRADAQLRGKLGSVKVIEESSLDLEGKKRVSISPAKVGPDDLAYIIFSGGTTGLPKGCLVTQRNLTSELFSMRRAHALPDDCVHMCVLPLYHASALYRSLLIPFSQGSTVVIPGEFSVERFWKWIDQFNVGYVQVVPMIVTMLLEHPGNPTARAQKSLHFIGSASAPLSSHTIEKFEKRFGVLIATAYGLTEASCGVFFNDPRDPNRRIDSVGRPIDIAQIIIRDEKGDPLPPNNLGEVVIRGPMICKGFLGGDDPDRRIKGDTLYTGDLAYFDDKGYLVIEGRKVDFIHRAGFKISPLEVEESLNSLDGIYSSAVFGVPHPILGEDVIAYVRTKKNEPIQEHILRQTLRKKLAAYKVPSRILKIEGDLSAKDFKKSRAFYRSLYMENRQRILNPATRQARRKPHPGNPSAFLWGDVIYFRPFMESDQHNKVYLANLTNPEVHELTHSGRFPQNEGTVKAFWDSLKLPHSMGFAVCDLSSDIHVGNVILKIDWIGRSAEFGRFFFREYQNPAYASESMRLIMEYVFEDMRLERLWGGGANPASLPSLIQLGFTLEGRMRGHDLLRGVRRDKFVVGMLDSEFRDVKNGIRPTQRTQNYDIPKVIMKKLSEVFADAFAISPSAITAVSSPADIAGWDSLGLIVLWNLIEEKFGIALESNDMVAVTCVGDIALAIETKLIRQGG